MGGGGEALAAPDDVPVSSPPDVTVGVASPATGGLLPESFKCSPLFNQPTMLLESRDANRGDFNFEIHGAAAAPYLSHEQFGSYDIYLASSWTPKKDRAVRSGFPQSEPESFSLRGSHS
jgi:hypothetical protein